jgi:hypothetical protein
VDLKTLKETTGHSWFAYQGPTPNERPASVNPADEVDDEAAPEGVATGATPAEANGAAAGAVPAGGAVSAKRQGLSGVWNRTKSVNFEAVIGATGAGFMQRKIAASMALAHTITLDATLQAVRLQEKGGPINIDFSLTIGATEAVPYDNNGKKLTHRAYWEGDSLVMHRVVVEGNYELVNKRTLDESTDAKQIVCQITFRDLKTGNEVEATSWFAYAGPSTSAAPVPDLTKLPKAAPVEDKKKAAEAAAAAAAAEEVDQDDDEDTDEVAIQKMRMSVMTPSSAASKLFAPAGVPGAANPGAGTRGGGGLGVDKPNFTGTWQRDMGSAPTLSSKFQLTHTIKLDATTFMLREQDCNSRVLEDLTLVIGGAPIEKAYGQKKLRCSCYWEGATLVVQQVNAAEGYELLVRRNLEEDGAQIRLTTTQRSLTTGEESESMSLFMLVGRKL